MEFKITARKANMFWNLAASICEVEGWSLSRTRFLHDGDRLQNDMTIDENNIEEHAHIDVVFEMVGGKGPTEGQIRKMLEEMDSESEDEFEARDNSNETTDKTREEPDNFSHEELNNKLYKELKVKLSEGTLQLSRSNDQDKKLLYLLETDSLQPYELLRLRNVYACWEHNIQWRKSSKQETKKPTESKVKEQATTTEQKSDRPKRNIAESFQRS